MPNFEKNNVTVVDLAVVHNCVEFISGFTSIRHRARGSRYVQTIVKVFMEQAHNSDIYDMLDQVYFVAVREINHSLMTLITAQFVGKYEIRSQFHDNNRSRH